MRNEEEYISILKNELLPAMGCTEPIAVALTAAKAKEVLGEFPERMEVRCSRDIIKNVQGVTIPNTGQLRGIHVAAIAGALCGASSRMLEVLKDVSEEAVPEIARFAKAEMCTVQHIESTSPLEIQVLAKKGQATAEVHIKEKHTNIVYIAKNGNVIFKSDEKEEPVATDTGYVGLTLEGILDFADQVDLSKVQDVLDKQIEYNWNIAEEGLSKNYGASVGKTICENANPSIEDLAKAYAAAGSDARMSGCDMPVVINSGSGNQGLTVSLPVLVYAQELQVNDEKRYRALLISNLVAIYVKSMIGRLSAFCGVVSAASGSGAAVTYLLGGDREAIKKAIVNTLGTASGMVCDGAKASCAAKIAVAVDTALMSAKMALKDRAFQAGEGLVKEDAEKTIQSIGAMARLGMGQTDHEILRIMLQDSSSLQRDF